MSALQAVPTDRPRANAFIAAIAAALLVALALSAAGCDPFDPDLGESPFRCSESGACPSGYTCEPTAEIPSGVCRSADEIGDDSGNGDGDGDTNLCADADLEPNDSPGNAVITQVPDQQLQYQASGLAVCPAQDIDLYRFRVAIANQNIRAEVTTNRSVGELIAEILNEQGEPLADGTYNASNTQLTVELQNAAADVYLLRVRGATGEVENDYDLDLQLSGP